MKKLLIILLGTGVFFYACNTSGSKENTSENSSRPVSTTEEMDSTDLVMLDIDVEGMTCTGCENTIKSGVSELEGIVEVEAYHKNGKTFVRYDSTITSAGEISEAIKSKGYRVTNVMVEHVSVDHSVEE